MSHFIFLESQKKKQQTQWVKKGSHLLKLFTISYGGEALCQNVNFSFSFLIDTHEDNTNLEFKKHFAN